MTPEPRSTARGLYHLFLGNVTASSLLALGSIAVARLLGPDGYGLYALALAALMALSVLEWHSYATDA